MKCNVNKKLVRIKLLIFSYYAGLACFGPYKPVYQKQLGMSPSQNGVIQALQMGVGVFSLPMFGMITDKTKAYKTILILCFLMSAVFTVPMLFIPPVERISISCCQTANTTILQCTYSENVDSEECLVENKHVKSIYILENSTEIFLCQNQTITAECLPNEDVYDITFTLLLIITILYAVFMAPLSPLTDSTIMDTLGEKDVHKYGYQRLWGAVGFGSIAFLSGFLLEQFSEPNSDIKNYIPSVINTGIFWGLSILTCWKLKVNAPKAKMIFKNVGILLKDKLVLAFLFVVFTCGFSTGVQFTYFFWFLESLEGGTKTVMGVSLFITCSSEIPMFLASGYICNKIGYITVLTIGLIAVSIRFFVYTVVSYSWQVLFVEILHGVSFALPLAAMVSYATVIAPKGLVATLISLSQACYWGLGNMSGSLIGGILYESVGGRSTFRITSIICVTVGIVYWCSAHKHDPALQKRKDKKPVSEEMQAMHSENLEPEQT